MGTPSESWKHAVADVQWVIGKMLHAVASQGIEIPSTGAAVPPATGPGSPAPPRPVPPRDEPRVGPTPTPTATEEAAAATEQRAVPPDATNRIELAAAPSEATVSESGPGRLRLRRIMHGVVVGAAPRT
ncbi:hypothetical protein B0H14DRAFT_2633761 [Mycena olivaceomarginata]|nr:hypothetical protein B0H14DRAFT_2633761 [Mycena olivaceomarginata]